MKKSLFFVAILLIASSALYASVQIESSITLPTDGTPEHRYTMVNGAGYYVSNKISPTQTKSNYANLAFYEVEGVSNAYYVYDCSSKKWLSYSKSNSYSAQTGFVSLSTTKVDGAYFYFNNYGGDNYEISPYTTSGKASIYLNWYKGIGSYNPVDGTVTLGLWTDKGASDAGSRWTFDEVGVKHRYTLFSDGMPSDAVVTIDGQEFRGLNAQGEQSIELESLSDDDVKVTVGGGYVACVTIDNANYQIDIKFIQVFLTTESTTAEKQYAYVMKMPLAYVKKSGANLVHTEKKSEADKFIFIEKNFGQYYIYDQTAKCYIYYTATTNGSSVKSTSSSNVRYTTSLAMANTWKLLAVSSDAVAIVPGSISEPNGSSASWNFTGGVAQSCVLNLWSANDSNSAWEIIDPTVGSMACATLMYALPGAQYIHKLVAGEGETITDVDFENITTLSLKDDRANVGNKYKYVSGTTPAEEGEYSYTVRMSNSQGEETQAKVRLIVSNYLQSPTPMMAWLTWNWFARAINHDKMVDIAKGMEKHGLIDAGFNTIVLDDAWAQATSDKSKLNYDSSKWPQGISGLKSALKQVNPNLKVGIYSDAGSMTCENYQPGSYMYESQHIALFDSWGVDMLKYDYCNSEASTKVSYSRMGEAIAKLNEQRKLDGVTPFVFNICEWGTTKPWQWGAEAGGSSWRATADAREDWIGNKSRPGVLAGVDEVRKFWMYAGVNRFNDLDMMCIGLHGLGGPSNNTMNHMSNGGTIVGLTDAQARTQMSLWCMLASPLALTCDLRDNPKGEANSSVTMPVPLITDADVATLTNKEILAINQDQLGQQAEYMEHLSTGTTNYSSTGYDVYVKDLSDNRFAVAVTNRSGSKIEGPSLNLQDLYMDPATSYFCHNVWTDEDTTIMTQLNVGILDAYETKVFVLEDENATSLFSAVKNGSTKVEGKIYDLYGRETATTPRKSIYIKNGKKMIKR